MQLQPDAHTPVYLQIVELLRSRIAAGIHRPGESLPSLRTLALDLKVNPNTVQRAFEEMERQGLIKSQRGIGMFVADRAPRSAQNRAEDAAKTAFEQTVNVARLAGLSDDRITDLFQSALDAAPRKERRA